ncbi:hypothetical protein EB052_00775 [bacterium]|nr:hypothetical protein [bacterium]
MNKQETIAFIERQVQSGVITREEVINLHVLGGGGMPSGSPVAPVAPMSYSVPTAATSVEADNKPRDLVNTFYGIGGVIVVIGIIILIVQHWMEIGFMGHILLTLGISLVTYISALIFNRPEHDKLSQVFFTISAALAPMGAVILCDKAGITFSTWSVQITTALILFVVYLAAFFVSRKSILVFVSTAFASWAYYAIILNVLQNAGGIMMNDWALIMKWATIIISFCYLVIGNRYATLRDFYYNVGTIGILGAGIMIGGFFDVVYIAFLFAAFYGSVYLKSRGMLTLGAMFLIAHIIKITSEHFADSIGWPIALVFIGFLVIGIGYGTLWINRRYISVNAA